MNDVENAQIVAPDEPYKDIEFEIFLRNIGNGYLPTWRAYALALGVDEKTIRRWRKHPLAQAAMVAAIAEDLENMKRAGAADWKMWREHAKIIGLDDIQTVKHEVDDDKISSVLQQLQKTNYDDLARKAQGQMVETKQPLQDQDKVGQS